MAQRRKTSKKKTERWNDPPRRGNPFGLLLILIGAGGLLYAACAPKVKHAVETAPDAVARIAPVIPRARYGAPRREAARPLDVEEKDDDDRSHKETSRRGRRARAHEADHAPPAAVIEEPPVALPKEPGTTRDEPKQRAESPRGPNLNQTPPAAKPQPAIAPVQPPRPRKAAPATGVISTAEFSRNPAAAGEVALTFDGCYDDRPLGDILAELDRRGYRATFFIAGIFADKFPQSVRRISDAGMEIGNHSWNHPAFTKLSTSEISRQLTRTNDLITKITGQKPDLFRPPFGARDNRVRKQLADEGFHTVYWALDSWDSVKKGITAKEISDRVLSRVKPGDVVLLHVGSRATADALPDILRGLDARGLRVVTVSRLMAGG